MYCNLWFITANVREVKIILKFSVVFLISDTESASFILSKCQIQLLFCGLLKFETHFQGETYSLTISHYISIHVLSLFCILCNYHIQDNTFQI